MTNTSNEIKSDLADKTLTEAEARIPFRASRTLGEVIRKAREVKGITRVKLAEFIDASINSMIKYEKAGDTDGQYPPLPKLVKICELLEIDPRRAFEMLAISGDVEVKNDFNFDHHFKDRDDGYNLEWISSNFTLLEHYFGEVFDRLDQIEKKIDELKLHKENGSD